MPKLWSETIEAHRRAVRDAALDAVAAVVAEQGPASVSMSQIAERTGIGRATLYKYFPDVESVLLAWHERQVGRHLEQLAEARDQREDAAARLESVLTAYARISHSARGHGDTELAALLHGHPHVAEAETRLREMVRDLVAEAASAGRIRADVSSDELAAYCLHALTAARNLGSKAAVDRLVAVTLAGLAPQVRAN